MTYSDDSGTRGGSEDVFPSDLELERGESILFKMTIGLIYSVIACRGTVSVRT